MSSRVLGHAMAHNHDISCPIEPGELREGTFQPAQQGSLRSGPADASQNGRTCAGDLRTFALDPHLLTPYAPLGCPSP